MEKAYTVEITDNETGETTTIETNAIIATFDEDEGSRQIVMTKCNAICLASLFASCYTGLKKAMAKNPLPAALAKVVAAETAKEGENDE